MRFYDRTFFYCLIAGTLFLRLNTGDVHAAQNVTLDYALWEQVLKKFVNDQGRVDYEGLKKDPDQFHQFIDQIEKMDIQQLSHVEQKAFWINAYNAITMKVILDHYPVTSIRLLNFGLVWHADRKVAAGKKSLGDIEHKILRPMGDPRIHFAINCASIGCPRLPNRPFYPETLEEQLDQEAKRFMNDPQKVFLDRKRNIIHHSAIFDWFQEDFLAVSPDLVSYIKKYIHEEDKRYLDEHPDVQLQVLKYNWKLNRQ